MKVRIRNIIFNTKEFANNSRYNSVTFEPKEKVNLMNHFLITYSTAGSVRALLSDLESAKRFDKSKSKYIGINESHIYADKEKVVFDMELVTELKPIELDLNDAIGFFSLYYDYLVKSEISKELKHDEFIVTTQLFSQIEDAIGQNTASSVGWAKRQLKVVLNVFLENKSLVIEDINIRLTNIEEYKKWKKERDKLNHFNSEELIKEIELSNSRNQKW